MLIEIKRQVLSELFQLTRTSFSEGSVDFVMSLIDADEWALPLEIIYDLLDESEVSISKQSFYLIQQLASMMEMNTRDWSTLEPQMKCEFP